jgi:hypothetical protein
MPGGHREAVGLRLLAMRRPRVDQRDRVSGAGDISADDVSDRSRAQHRRLLKRVALCLGSGIVPASLRPKSRRLYFAFASALICCTWL